MRKDDWITKLFYNMTTINNDGIFQTLKTKPIVFNVALHENHITSRVLTFSAKFHILNENEKIHIKDLSFQDWMELILCDKLVIPAGEYADLRGEFDKFFKDRILEVNNISNDYICKTLFGILSTLLPEGISLIELTYE